MGSVIEMEKTYERKISVDYQSWTFSTKLKKVFDTTELDTKEKFLAESEKLFAQTKAVTELDIKKYESELTPKKVG